MGWDGAPREARSFGSRLSRARESSLTSEAALPHPTDFQKHI